MFARIFTAIVFVTVTGALLLVLRHQRYVAMHEMARLHEEMNRSRQQLWDTQAKIAMDVRPQALRAAIAQAKLELEPVTPAARPATGPVTVRTADSRSSRHAH